MLEACRESRHSGKMVEKLVEGIAVQVSLESLQMVEMMELVEMVELVGMVEMVGMVELVGMVEMVELVEKLVLTTFLPKELVKR